MAWGCVTMIKAEVAPGSLGDTIPMCRSHSRAKYLWLSESGEENTLVLQTVFFLDGIKVQYRCVNKVLKGYLEKKY